MDAVAPVARRHVTPLLCPLHGFASSAGHHALIGPCITVCITLCITVQGRESLSLSDQLLLSQQHQPQSPLMLLLPAFQLVPQQHGLPHDSHLQRQQQQQQHSSGKQAKQLYIPDNQQVHVPRTKPELLQALQNGSVRPFDCGVFAPQQQVRLMNGVSAAL